MVLDVENLGKTFGRNRIFRDLSFRADIDTPTVILGGNGSGKSTLLRILAGQMLPSEGKVTYQKNGKAILEDELFRYITWVAPALELVEEMTLKELLRFHTSFRELTISEREFLETLQFDKVKNRQICHFSSGMKQRLQLGLAFYDTSSSLLFLDEPTMNLDDFYTGWYRQEMVKQLGKRTVIIASNQKKEYEDFVKQKIFVDLTKNSPNNP
ncbi:MAG: ATP-binding cassette domain-containing protein [Bacteroidota bacterium]